MRTQRKHYLAVIVISFFFALNECPHVIGQIILQKKPGAENQIKELPKITATKPIKIQLEQKKPIKFVPLTLHDINPEVKANQEFTFKGKIVTAKQLEDHINEIEKLLNKKGYSLRTLSKDISKNLARINNPITKLQRKMISNLNRPNFGSPLLLEPQFFMNSIQKLNFEAGNIERENALLGIVRGSTQCIPSIRKDTTWIRGPFGDDYISAAVTGSESIRGTLYQKSISSTYRAYCSVFGNEFDLMRIDGSLSGDTTGNGIGKITGSILGESVNFDITNPISGEYWPDCFNKTLTEPIDIPFNLWGIVDGVFTLQLQVVTGFCPYMNVQKSSIVYNFSAIPTVSLIGDFKISIELFNVGAEAGIDANVTILNDYMSTNLKVYNYSNVSYINPLLYVGYNEECWNNLTGLSGFISGYVTVDYLIGSHTWSGTLYSWDPLYNFTETILSDSKSSNCGKHYEIQRVKHQGLPQKLGDQTRPVVIWR